ncbi:MAG: protocatechuate 3,4-dioxygenase subunit beta [Gammaproteobacteria bacterium]|nr:protocatechuate 3,4-dioxygenase subunit beta [Gammaproteobacteria bacterium]
MTNRAESEPPFLYPGYKSTVLRAPTQAPIALPKARSTQTGPQYGAAHATALDADLTKNGITAKHIAGGQPLGERIIVTGQVRDDRARPVAGALIELWQANAAGRYVHSSDAHDAPLDPNFFGAGKAVTDAHGHYCFLTIKPGAYPWGNHHNGWRPAHIHYSLFGASIASRLITQLYFPGDPLLQHDPIFHAVPAHARDRLVAQFSLDATAPGFALGYVFDIVLSGGQATPLASSYG